LFCFCFCWFVLFFVSLSLVLVRRTLRGGARTERVVGDARALFADAAGTKAGDATSSPASDGKDDFAAADAPAETTAELEVF
jgi:hypothetical protein